jgi:peptide/nickel transport system permease protein
MDHQGRAGASDLSAQSRPRQPVETIRALGRYIILADILPYIASYVVMALILQISAAILAEAGLSILGLGPKTTLVPTLGLMMNWALIYQAQVLGKWWAYLPVIIVIALISFSLNLMNTGLDQVFNPTLRD